MKNIKLNRDEILKIQMNRDPYLMIDHADEIIIGKKSRGYKHLKNDEWFFKVHWPGDPNMPGMLQLEDMSQMASLIILSKKENHKKLMYLVSMDKIRFFKKVVPENKLQIETELINWNRGIGKFVGKCMINNDIVSKAEFKLMLLDELRKYNK